MPLGLVLFSKLHFTAAVVSDLSLINYTGLSTLSRSPKITAVVTTCRKSYLSVALIYVVTKEGINHDLKRGLSR